MVNESLLHEGDVLVWNGVNSSHYGEIARDAKGYLFVKTATGSFSLNDVIQSSSCRVLKVK